MTPLKILTAFFLVKLGERSFAFAAWATRTSKCLIATEPNKQKRVSTNRRELPEHR